MTLSLRAIVRNATVLAIAIALAVDLLLLPDRSSALAVRLSSQRASRRVRRLSAHLLTPKPARGRGRDDDVDEISQAAKASVSSSPVSSDADEEESWNSSTASAKGLPPPDVEDADTAQLEQELIFALERIFRSYPEDSELSAADEERREEEAIHLIGEVYGKQKGLGLLAFDLGVALGFLDPAMARKNAIAAEGLRHDDLSVEERYERQQAVHESACALNRFWADRVDLVPKAPSPGDQETESASEEVD